MLAVFLAAVACGGPLPQIEADGQQPSGQVSSPEAASLGKAGKQAEAAARKPAFTADGPVVALGDSYTAGLLLPLDSSAEPPGCFRSTANYGSLVARALHAPAFADAACQSAGVADLNHPSETTDGDNPPQTNSLAPDDSLVMLTLGGDDLGFSHVLKGCMDPFGGPCQSVYSRRVPAQISAEKPKMIAALGEIHHKAPHARVLLLGYPDLFPDRGACLPFTTANVAFLRSAELSLNAMLAEAAAASGTTYVDTYRSTGGHDMCQSAQVKDVEGLIPSSTAMAFHPNARGQAAMADQVLAALGLR